MPARNADDACPCASGYPFAACCAPFIAGLGVAPTAVSLMRSRYTAYTLGKLDYLRQTWDPETCPENIDADPRAHWLGLKVLASHDGEAGDTRGTVEFVARFRIAGRAQRLHETSRFRFEAGRWYYLDGDLNKR